MIDKEVHIQRRDKEDNLYNRLQKQSIDLIQRLSGNVWTDFNEHDPGVTLLDVLNFALLELEYTGTFSFEEYLAYPDSRKLHFEKVGLLPSQELFSPSVVTTQDYEQLFIERVEGLSNCLVILNQEGLYYTVLIDPMKDKKEEDIRTIIEKIEVLYHQNRNLCENLGEIRVAKLDHTTQMLKKDIFSVVYEKEQEKVEVPLKTQMEYRSVQYDLPDCYGINEKGLPSGYTPERRNQALQLKAYLLVFDYLLSGIQQQTKNIHQLLELSERIPADFLPEVEIEDIKSLLDRNKLNTTIVFSEKNKHQQKARFLDYLDRMYGEDTLRYVKEEQTITAQNAMRSKLIRRLPMLNQQRFRSFNLLDGKAESLPGIKQLIGLVLGHDFTHETPVINNFSRYNLKLVSDTVFFDKLKGLLKLEFIIEDLEDNWEKNPITEIPVLDLKTSEKDYYALRSHVNLLWHGVIFESFLEQGMISANYRAVALHDKNGYLMLYKQPGREEWINMGFFFEINLLHQCANRLWKLVEILNHKSMSFYLIEHILLTDSPIDSQILNKLTIVIPRWIERFYAKETYIELFRERLPAHLDVNCLWLSSGDMTAFEKVYFKWRKSWASKDGEKTMEYSAEIRSIISE